MIEDLPPVLPADRIVAANRPATDLHTERAYRWNGWELTVPPGVFRPGRTSETIFERVLSGEIETRGRRYLVAGCGLGVEVAAAAARGAAEVLATDVHPASVAVAAGQAGRLVPGSATRVRGVVADLAAPPLPDLGGPVDVVTFNPPAVSVRVGEHPDVVRNVCTGAGLLERFFACLAAPRVLAPGAGVYVIASNTAELHRITADAAGHGFGAEVVHRIDWDSGVVTLLFRFTR